MSNTEQNGTKMWSGQFFQSFAHAILLITIPIALFSEICMENGFIRSITNVAAMSLLIVSWNFFEVRSMARIDILLSRTYVIGLFVFSIWLGLNLVVRETYSSSWHNNRDAAIRSLCLNIEPSLVYFGVAVAVLFTFLCVVRIVITIRTRFRQTSNLKANNV